MGAYTLGVFDKIRLPVVWDMNRQFDRFKPLLTNENVLINQTTNRAFKGQLIFTVLWR